jgi:hypothetical protein
VRIYSFCAQIVMPKKLQALLTAPVKEAQNPLTFIVNIPIITSMGDHNES